MSADNWALCPRCKAEKMRAAAERLATVQASYGVVTAAQFVTDLQQATSEVAAAERWGDSERDYTFREDYELGLWDDGLFHVTYSGRCTVCGYGLDFKHEQEIT